MPMMEEEQLAALRRQVDELAAAYAPLSVSRVARMWVVRLVSTTVPVCAVGLGAWGLGAEPLAALRVAIGGWACVGLPLSVLGLAASAWAWWSAVQLVESIQRLVELVEREVRR